jgi:mono/diheme cytochrome c family protein
MAGSLTPVPAGRIGGHRPTVLAGRSIGQAEWGRLALDQGAAPLQCYCPPKEVAMPATAAFRLIVLLVPLLAAAAPTPAWADSVDTSAGRALAEAWCAECHDITGDYSELMGITDYGDPPSFYAVANDPAVTEIALRAFLHTPHQAMPNLILQEPEMAALIDYILSLRER